MTRIAFVLADDFEDVELETPRATMLRQGLDVDVIGTSPDDVTGKRGAVVSIDKTIDDVSVDDYDTLVVPGGYSPDKLRTDDRIVDFVRSFDEQEKTIAAVCHGPSLLIEAGVVNGRTLTSWPSIRTDLRNAGADVVDREVAIDGHVITSRNPDDLAAFTDAILANRGDVEAQELAGDNSFTA